MSNLALNKPVPEERHITIGKSATGLVRFPKTNELPPRRLELVEDSAFDNRIRTFYRQLGSSRSRDGKSIQTLGLTSCYRREGTSTVGEYLASVAAESQRVLLLDVNESLHSIHKGMRDFVLNGFAVANEETPIGQARQQPPTDTRPSECTYGKPTIDETRGLVRLLSSKFDLIVFDLPPLDSANVLDWAPLLDGIVLVIESERIRWQVAAKGIESLEQAGSHVLGTVLNKQREYIPHWLYKRL